jgi:ADP-ribosylation factor-like protein 5B
MVIDSTDINRLNLAQQELHQMMESDVRYGVSFLISWFLNVSFFFFQQLQNASLLVFANKQDVKGSLGAAKISDALGLSKLKDRQWHIQVK